MRYLLAAAVLVFGAGASVSAQCVDDPADPYALPFSIDFIFEGLDGSLAADFPEWLDRYAQENTGDPTAVFAREDNSQNGLNDDDHIALLGAILTGEPAASALAGIDAGTVEDIRASYAANRAKVRPDLTLTIVFVTVNIIDEINAGDPDFGASLLDLVAAYMTIGDAESLAFIRGLLITLGEIFIEQGVESGDIPGIAEGPTKNALRSTVNDNFVASRYECYGDAPDATEPNLLGDTGTIGGSQTNEAAYDAANGDREAWLMDLGVTLPPLAIAVPPEDITTTAGMPATLEADVVGGDGTPIGYDWKRIDPDTEESSRAATTPALAFEYPLPSDSGLYTLYVCDATWTRTSASVLLTVEAAPFGIATQPQGAERTAGEDYTFSVSMQGGESVPTYAWYFGEQAGGLVPIPGANERELALTNLTEADAGFYRVRVTGTDDGQPVTRESNIVALAVVPRPDITPPVLTLQGDNPLVLACGDAFADPGAIATDDRDGDLTSEITVQESVDMAAPGDYTITYNVADDAGNTATDTRLVQVRDTGVPVLSLAGAATVVVECGAAYAEPGFTASDGCAGGLTGDVEVAGDIDTSTPGGYTRTYSVSDPSGNTATATRTVRVRDTRAPVLSLAGAASVEVSCGAGYEEPGYSATDTCDGDVTDTVSVAGTVDSASPGTYTLTYTASDAAGNTADAVRVVTVADDTPPELTLAGEANVTLACGEAFDEPGFSAVDTCDGELSDSVTVGGAVDETTPGTYTLTYEVSDAAGNTADAVRVVTVADDTPPELTLVGEGNVTLACGEAFDEPGFSAVDTCDGELSDSVTVGGAVDETTPGTYTLTYQVSDAAGNTAEAARAVMVEDDTPPELTLAGADAITLECGEDYQEPGFAATDTCDGDLTDAVNVESAVDAATPGSYTVTYRVTDRAGNMAEAVRTVTIEDTTPPEVTLLGMAEVEVSCGSAFDDAGAVAVDACEGDLTDAVVVSGTVNTSQPGVYTLTYSATDKAGNTGEAVRAVRILNDCEIGISRQPAPLSLFVGTSAVLSLTATGGSDTLGYTWRKDGNVLNAPDLPRLQLTAVTLEGAGEYTCVVSDGVTSATSDPAIVSVFPLPDTAPHSADTNGDWAIALTELLRIIQFFNAGEFSCQADTEDGYVPGDAGNRDCPFHNSDYEPRDWRLSLTELLRIIQFFNQPASLYHRLEGTEDGFAPGAG